MQRQPLARLLDRALLLVGVAAIVLAVAVVGWMQWVNWQQAQMTANAPQETLPERFEIPASPVMRRGVSPAGTNSSPEPRPVSTRSPGQP